MNETKKGRDSKQLQKVYVGLGIFELMVDRVRVASSKQRARIIEKEMCNQLEVPLDKRKREREFADGEGTTVQVIEVKVE